MQCSIVANALLSANDVSDWHLGGNLLLTGVRDCLTRQNTNTHSFIPTPHPVFDCIN